MTKTSKLAFLAGLADGDGAISISIIKRKDGNWIGHSFEPYVSLGMTSRKLCKWAQKHFGGNLYGYDQPEGHQKMWHWKLYGNKAIEKLLIALLPYLLIKREAAEVVMEYMALGSSRNPTERMKIALKVQEANEKNHLVGDKRILTRRESFAYLAGIVDSEGDIGIRDNNGQAFGAFVKINNTNSSVIQWVQSLFAGCLSLHEYTEETYRDNHLWSIYSKKNIENFLLAVIPYLVIKKEVANIALQFVRLKSTWNKEERARLHSTIKKLQVRQRNGTPTTNAPNTSEEVKIESDLNSDVESASLVTATA
jgi:hypothetical protein